MELLRTSTQLESVAVGEDYVLLAESSLTGDMWDGQVSVYHRLPGRVTKLAAAPQPAGVAEAEWWGKGVACVCDNGDLVVFPSHTLDSPRRVPAHHSMGTAISAVSDHVMTAAEDE